MISKLQDNEVILEVSSINDKFRFICRFGKSRLFDTLANRKKTLNFVFSKDWVVVDSRISDDF